MKEEKITHRISTMIVFIALAIVGYTTTQIIFEFFTDQYNRTSGGEALIALAVFLFLLYAFVLHIKSFNACKLKNNWFLVSFLLDVFVLLGSIVFHVIFSNHVQTTGGDFALIGVVIMAIFISGLIIFISMILFLIGCTKNKINQKDGIR